jgi:hypothetical protein
MALIWVTFLAIPHRRRRVRCFPVRTRTRQLSASFYSLALLTHECDTPLRVVNWYTFLLICHRWRLISPRLLTCLTFVRRVDNYHNLEKWCDDILEVS